MWEKAQLSMPSLLACTYPWALVFWCFGLFDVLDLYDLFDLFDVVYTLETYLLQNELIRQRKHKGGRSLNIEVLMANTTIKLSFD